MNSKILDSLSPVKFDKQQLRQAEQATYAYRGTFIVSQMSTTVIPAWRVKRERKVTEMNTKPNLRLVAGGEGHRHG